MTRDRWFGEILECPLCKGGLMVSEGMVCRKCRRSYKQKQGVLILLNINKSITEERLVKSFYEEYPYDIEEYKIVNISDLRSFSKIIFKGIKKEDIVVDVGCGVGRDINILSSMGVKKVIGVDQSLNSLLRVKRLSSELFLVNASNFFLPFKDNSIDVVISKGVIHHTGNTRKALEELIRITKPGGKIYLSVYKKWGGYFFIYKTVGGLARIIYYHLPFGKVLTRQVFMRAFHVLDSLITKRGRSLTKSRAFYADYLITPIADFNTKSTIKNWLGGKNVKFIFYPNSHPDMISAILRK